MYRYMTIGTALAAVMCFYLGAAQIGSSTVVKGAGNTAAETTATPVPATSQVAALDRCIQQRFHTLTSFGMARIPMVPSHLRRFKPETEQEKSAVEDLEAKGQAVVLYLGGRGLLQPKMSKEEWEKTDKYSLRRAISSPLWITAEPEKAKAPEPWELWEPGQKALLASRTADRYTSSLGQWLIDARPVRANQAGCLKCHTAEGAPGFRTRDTKPLPPLHVGDAVGVVIYVYAPLKK